MLLLVELVFLFLYKFHYLFALLETALILPHGDVALDPTFWHLGTDARKAADEIHAACKKAAAWLNEKQPELIFFSTPHGISLTNDVGVYMNAGASGSVELGNDIPNALRKRVSINNVGLAPKLAIELVNTLKGLNVSGVLSPGDDITLYWAEVIPLLTLQNNQTNPMHLIFTHPLRRYTRASTIVDELLMLGRSIRAYLDATTLRVAVAISGDLSHTHQATGPYGYSNSSALFDRAVGMWASDPCQYAKQLLTTARVLQPTALSFGFTGFVLLYGILQCETTSWENAILVNRHASYFGMMVSQHERLDLMKAK
jgi:aromatic ring-opening dioxygenase LigB subunit